MTDKMREEFEAWAFQCPWLGLSEECMARDEINGGYYGLELHAAWLAWQASREALLKKQDQEQEEFLAHLADFKHEDTFHG